MTSIRSTLTILVLLLPAACSRAPASSDVADTTHASLAVAVAAAAAAAPDPVARGGYLVRIAGCNDCHTAGYPERAGEVPKEQWLLGSPLGWNGPWGTTFAANLRLKLQDMDEAAWLEYSAQLHTRPPMPDFAVRAMTEADRRAIYRFIRSLGPGGQPAPAYRPPGENPQPPYVRWVLPPGPPPQVPAAG